jgi:hypothetical protein
MKMRGSAQMRFLEKYPPGRLHVHSSLLSIVLHD